MNPTVLIAYNHVPTFQLEAAYAQICREIDAQPDPDTMAQLLVDRYAIGLELKRRWMSDHWGWFLAGGALLFGGLVWARSAR